MMEAISVIESKEEFFSKWIKNEGGKLYDWKGQEITQHHAEMLYYIKFRA